jgi:hypothetical protein
MGHLGKNLFRYSELILTVARLPVICTRFLFSLLLLDEGSKSKTTTPIDGRSQRTAQI